MAIADFRRDVARPEAVKAENLVYQHLRHSFPQVGDCRPLNIAWDFTFTYKRKLYRLDVKYDTYIGESDNYPFEICNVQRSGIIRPTWGLCNNLDYLAVVDVGLDYAFIANVPLLRKHVLKRLGVHYAGLGKPNWPFIRIENVGGYTTIGVAVPMDEMRQNSIKIQRVPLSQYRAEGAA